MYLKITDLFFKYLQISPFTNGTGLPYVLPLHKYKLGSSVVFFLLKWTDKKKIQIIPLLSKHMG